VDLYLHMLSYRTQGYFTPGPANFNPHEGSINHKDSPEGPHIGKTVRLLCVAIQVMGKIS